MPKKASLVVAGDVTIDILQWEIPPRNLKSNKPASNENWALYKGFRMKKRYGGSLHLAKMIKIAAGRSIKTASQQNPNMKKIFPNNVIHSLAILDKYSVRVDDKKHKVYRVKHFCGYSGPDTLTPAPLPIINDNPDADFIVLDDAGNNFRHLEKSWPNSIKNERKKPFVIYKMSRPLTQGELWKKIIRHHKDQTVVIINANDLREHGVNISRRLSWEKTVLDFCLQLNNPLIKELCKCKHIIIRFGLDGAIFLSKTNDEFDVKLIYDPQATEDQFKEKFPGDMQGLTAAFVAGFTEFFVKSPDLHEKEQVLKTIEEGIIQGIRCSRKLFIKGFGDGSDIPDYPDKDLFKDDKDEKFTLASIEIQHGKINNNWTIFNKFLDENKQIDQVANNIVKNGLEGKFKDVPTMSFGKLFTIDRSEIESYQSIKNIMGEYLEKEDQKIPLSISVFGPPGSGKSFGVAALAENIKPEKVKKMTFNVAQFKTSEDLICAFHKARDCVLKGITPLIFFDEFDSYFENKEFGWLKLFLAPMNDGVFLSGETMHPIGKSIFVFAGATCDTFEEFKTRCDSADTKGSDFVSRLRGYVNVIGPNPDKKQWFKNVQTDHSYKIRRALLLRDIVKEQAPHIIDSNGEMKIDEGVSRAFIQIPRYEHGVRSMKAIVAMSMLSKRRSYEQSSLPPVEQLNLHVNGEKFWNLVLNR